MKTDNLVLGIYPFTRGFGWILFENPRTPLDWGVVQKKQDRNAQCLLAVGRIVERYHPLAVVLEEYERPPTLRIARIRRLCRSIRAFCRARDIEVAVYSRADIRTVFARAGAVSRQEIAASIAHNIAALRPRLPKKRAIWESEKPGMALFNAAAMAVTYFAVTQHTSG